MTEKTYTAEVKLDPESILTPESDITGLYGRMPPDVQRRVRRIQDAHNYDFAAAEFLNMFEIEWRK